MTRKARLILYVAAFVLAILAGWAFWWEPSSLIVVRRTVDVHPWSPELAGLKVAMISDLHVGSPYNGLPALRQVVSVTNAENPDLVLLFGDFLIKGVLGGHFVPPEAISEELAKLRAPLGVFAVLGNHDWGFNGPRVRSALEAQGICVLDDEVASVTYHGQSFWLAGLEDLWTRGNGLVKTLKQIQGNDPILLMMHNPDLFPSVPDRVSLSLAGHTHGGQVNLPLLGRIWVPSKYGQRYAYGFVEERGRKMVVTSGVGTSIIPVRFRVPPEIVILQIEPDKVAYAN